MINELSFDNNEQTFGIKISESININTGQNNEDLTRRIDTLEDKVNSLENSYSDLETQIEENSTALNELNEQLEKTTENVSNITDILITDGERISNLETQIGDINTALETALNGGVS